MSDKNDEKQPLDPLPLRFYRMLKTLPPMGVDSKSVIKGRNGNVAYTNNYLSLNGLLAIINPLADKEHFTFIQRTSVTDGIMTVDTVALGEEGAEFPLGSYGVKIVDDPQAVGKSITYARRYALFSALGIYPDKDDDGAYAHYKANGIDPQQAEQKPAIPQPTISKEQAEAFRDACHVRGLNIRMVMKEATGRTIGKLGQITLKEYEQIVQYVNQYEPVAQQGEAK